MDLLVLALGDLIYQYCDFQNAWVVPWAARLGISLKEVVDQDVLENATLAGADQGY